MGCQMPTHEMTSNEKLALLLRAYDLPQPEYEYAFYPTRQWRFDAAYPELGIAIEIEGGAFTRGAHNRPKRFLSDMEKYNAAQYLNWRLLRVVPDKDEMVRDSLKFVKLLQSLMSRSGTIMHLPLLVISKDTDLKTWSAFEMIASGAESFANPRGQFKTLAESAARLDVKWRNGLPNGAHPAILRYMRNRDNTRWCLPHDLFA